jgi:hypothetical protein
MAVIVIVSAKEIERLLAAQEEMLLGKWNWVGMVHRASSIEALVGLASCCTGQPRAKASLDWLGTLENKTYCRDWNLQYEPGLEYCRRDTA